MPIAGHAVMAPGEIACTNEAWGLRSPDPRAIVLISELQVDDVTMTRLAYYQPEERASLDNYHRCRMEEAADNLQRNK